MKRNSVLKSIAVSVALSTVLAGCGSSSSTDDNSLKATTISGKAVDGYLQYSTVCLDISGDGYCQSTEPMTTTDKDGSFKLDITPEIQQNKDFSKAMLLVYGGKDVDSGADFRGKLFAPQDAKVVNITPITTLVAKAVQKELKANPKLSKEDIDKKVQEQKQKVADVFGLEVSELVKDPVAEKEKGNDKLIKEALKLHKAVEAVNIDGDNDALEDVYEILAESLEQAQRDGLFDVAFKDDSQKLKIAKEIDNNIELAFEKLDGDLEKIAHIAKEDMKKIKNNEDIKLDEDDEIFSYDDAQWDDMFIRSGLDDIGIENPTDEEINKLKEKIGDEHIKPGFIFEKKDELKDSDDQFFKNIFEKIEHKKQDKKDDVTDIDSENPIVIQEPNQQNIGHTELEKKFIGMFIYFKDGSQIYFNNDLAYFQNEEREYIGSWSVDGQNIEIKNDSSSMRFSFPNIFKDGPSSDLKDGDTLTFSSKNAEGFPAYKGLQVDYIGA